MTQGIFYPEIQVIVVDLDSFNTEEIKINFEQLEKNS